MDDCLPLTALLSHLFVAFTIEFDNEAERRMPHRTTNHGRTPGSFHAPWLVSMTMWWNCMRFVGEEGITVRELERLARTRTNLPGMERWGYIFVEPNPADPRPKPPHSDWVIRATVAGRKAKEVCRPLVGVIEKRWQERFGAGQIEQLRQSLLAVISQFAMELPDCLPILGYGLFSSVESHDRNAAAESQKRNLESDALPALLAKVLLAFAIEFEQQSDVSLAIGANVLRLAGKAVRVRDLPREAGVSKEAIATALSYLEKRGCAVIKPEPGSRTKALTLTEKGRDARNTYIRLLAAIEEQWTTRFGEDAIRSLRHSLEQVVGNPAAQPSLLFSGLEPCPDGWRASMPKPEQLPHYPMVLHRGGFPDGS